MLFAILCVTYSTWVLSAASSVYLNKPVKPLIYFLTVLWCTTVVLAYTYKLSFGG